MASLNRVHLIGRLTRDPETRTFPNGGKVAQLGFAVTGERRKNQQTGQWEEIPCFLDAKAFNRQNGRQLADTVATHLHKGDLCYLEGHLVLEQWEDKNGGKRSKLVMVIDNLEFLQPKNGTQPRQPPPRHPGDEPPDHDGDIPF